MLCLTCAGVAIGGLGAAVSSYCSALGLSEGAARYCDVDLCGGDFVQMAACMSFVEARMFDSSGGGLLPGGDRVLVFSDLSRGATTLLSFSFSLSLPISMISSPEDEVMLPVRCLLRFPRCGVMNLLFPVVRLELDVLASSSDKSENVRSMMPPLSLERSMTSIPELLEFDSELLSRSA